MLIIPPKEILLMQKKKLYLFAIVGAFAIGAFIHSTNDNQEIESVTLSAFKNPPGDEVDGRGKLYPGTEVDG